MHYKEKKEGESEVITALRQEAAASPRSRRNQSTALQKEQQSRVQGPPSLVGDAGALGLNSKGNATLHS